MKSTAEAEDSRGLSESLKRSVEDGRAKEFATETAKRVYADFDVEDEPGLEDDFFTSVTEFAEFLAACGGFKIW